MRTIHSITFLWEPLKKPEGFYVKEIISNQKGYTIYGPMKENDIPLFIASRKVRVQASTEKMLADLKPSNADRLGAALVQARVIQE